MELFQAAVSMEGMKTLVREWEMPACREPWPLARLLMVAALFVLWGKSKFGWTAAAVPMIGKTAEGMLGVLLLCGLVSRRLGLLYIAIVGLPVWATLLLNDWLYRGSYWIFRTVLRLLYDRRVSAVVALLAEFGLFLAAWELAATVLRNYGA